ncbi:MAG: hypothetical protein OXD29_03470 [Roseovarius sp.]|nr:hypothetical protein [Roseovarius sp.]
MIGEIADAAMLEWIMTFYAMRKIGLNLVREAKPIIMTGFALLCFGWRHAAISPKAAHSAMEAS